MLSAINQPLASIVESSWELGQEIDLTGIGYGRIHWGNYKDESYVAFPYYRFLAGLVRFLQAKFICEIGTHAGGSARAMARGFQHPESSLIVTIDTSRESDKFLKRSKNIKKIRGDANSRKVIAAIIDDLAVSQFDLLYIDANHTFLDTMLNYAIYRTIFRPSYVVLDDVKLNCEMRRVWSHLQLEVPEADIVDAVTVVPEIRSEQVGFGLVRLCK